ncbi:MAG: DUF1571 domain-containing protein [Candidatus Methylomirabilales bacterium]
MPAAGRAGAWRRLVYAVCGLSLLPCAAPVGAATVADLLRLIEHAERRYEAVRDYTSVMVSVERLGDVLQPEKRVLLKFQRPFKVYMRWLEGPGAGREGLYVAGAHDGKFIVAEAEGIARFVTAALAPDDPRVLEKSRHPVTDVGIGRLLEIVGENARRGAREHVLRVVDRGVAEIDGRPVHQLEGILPRDPAAGYYGYRVILAFDREYGLPTRVVVYDAADRLVEDYTYLQLRLNAGLTDRDFDRNNPEYAFARWRLRLP